MSQDVVGAGDGRGSEPVAVEKLGYEEARDELVETVKLLELGQMGLDDSLALWERGEELATLCRSRLDGAQERIEARVAERAESD